MPTANSPALNLPSLADQAERLIDLAIPRAAGLSDEALRDLVRTETVEDALLVVDPGLVPPSRLAPLLERDGRPGFVVVDMPDVDEFAPVPELTMPDTTGQTSPYHLVQGLSRGDELANWSPAEAMPALLEAGRTPLTLAEGIHWVLQQPAVLERNLCFMTLGSRLRRSNGGFDARTPAVWISNGTGRDGRERRNAPKVGWCWWNNRHTWLGFASAARRSGCPSPGVS